MHFDIAVTEIHIKIFIDASKVSILIEHVVFPVDMGLKTRVMDIAKEVRMIRMHDMPQGPEARYMRIPAGHQRAAGRNTDGMLCVVVLEKRPLRRQPVEIRRNSSRISIRSQRARPHFIRKEKYIMHGVPPIYYFIVSFFSFPANMPKAIELCQIL